MRRTFCPALATGNALPHRGYHGPGQLGRVAPERIVARGHHVLCAGLEIPQCAQRADNAPADRLDHLGHVGIGGRLALEKARLPSLGRAIDTDPLSQDNMIMHMRIERPATALETRDGAGLNRRALRENRVWNADRSRMAHTA